MAVPVEDEIALVTLVRSASAIMDTSDASLSTMMNSLATDGTRRLIDCGKMTSRIVCALDNPNALEASNCPLSIDWIAALINSEQYAALFNEKARKAAKNRLLIVSAILICGSPK